MTFREMTVEDLEQVVEIENRLFSDPWTKEGFFTFLTKENTMFFVIEEKEKILAYCSMQTVLDEGDILADLRANFQGECSEVGMYLAMARVAHREGYPEIGLYWEKAAYEEAEHAAKFAELLGEVVTDSTKKNLQMRVEAENGATAGKMDLAKRAKAANLDAIHDTVHEMARDEARHGKAFAGLLKRYFGE